MSLKTYLAKKRDTVSATILTLIVTLLSSINLYAQFKQTIDINTHDTQLTLAVDQGNKIRMVRFGKLLSQQPMDLNAQDMPEIYPAFGVNVAMAALKITHADGNPTTELIYQSHSQSQIDSNVVFSKIKLKDTYYPVEVTLCYKAYQKENMIEQWAEISHGEKGKIIISEAASAVLPVNQSAYFLTYFNGDWMNEFNHYQTQLKPGNMILESREGVRTAQKTNPSFLLALDKPLQEETGQVIGASLAWPGNWQMQFNVDQNQKLSVNAGTNPYASAYHLKPAVPFQTPSLLYTFSNLGAGEVTRRFHRWARSYGIHNGKGNRETVLNNWETTGMDFSESQLARLLKQGGELGLERFLLDDGWFGNQFPRNNDRAGLGDWEVNKSKLPQGIKGLISESEKNHLKFGIWVEPEMVNPQSSLYKNHPKWALSAPHRPLDLQRNQLILDLSNPEVQQYLISSLDRLIKGNPGLDYLKWDCNRYLTNAWSNYLPAKEQSNLYIDYAKGLLFILSEFRKRHPNTTLMLCASGGGRMDYGSLKYFDEYWPSDNSNAHDRINIQWGMNYFYPSIGFAAHVSEMGRESSLKFRFDVAMAGKLGMDMQLEHLKAADKEFAVRAIGSYGKVKDIVLHGDLYRLLSPYENDRASMMYVNDDQSKGVLFAFLMKKGNGGDFSAIYPRGLDPDAKYRITEVNKGSYSRVEAYENKVFSGSYLMEEGLRFSMWNIDESSVLLLSKE